MCILGEPTERQGRARPLRLALAADLDRSGNFIHTAFSEGKRGRELDPAHARGARRGARRGSPPGRRPGERLPRRRRRSSTSARSQGGFGWRVSRTPHRTDLFLDVRVPPTKPMAAARARGARRWCAALRERFPDYGIEGEVYVTAPGRRDRRGPPADRRDRRRRTQRGLRRAARRATSTRWFSDASALTALRRSRPSTTAPRPGCSTRPTARTSRSPGSRDRAGLRARGDATSAGRRHEARHLSRDGGDGRARRRRARSSRLDVPDMRTLLRARRRRRRRGRARRRSPTRACSAPIVPKKFFHTAGNFREHEEESKNVDWSHEIAPWIVFFQNVDAIVGPDEPVVYPEHLTEELDYELELAVVIAQGRQVVRARGGGGLHRRLRDLQRHHRARHPAARDALRRVLLLQGDRHVLPARPVDRHARRDPRPARPRDDAAGQRRAPPGLALEPHVGDDPRDPQPLLGARLHARATSSRPAPSSGVAGFSDGRGLALPAGPAT